ncbi:hypothetical protein HMPREF1250_1765 [Megasphaera vaginalis (ex Srinivasan et al. 2021)]|uniref:Uncharacterized protein n=1 Tax=Megasphaera vaginalis (ex Srinivasan et al. 2021) TaxID=1111454 RepID=U7UFH4_9FIRM|nr:hypothetical protein HMPREF1250_1765 [Megasphaera vaginalis (ex Srinivasan et al. 2021)]
MLPDKRGRLLFCIFLFISYQSELLFLYELLQYFLFSLIK